MRRGLPVLATPDVGMSEVVRSAGAGAVVDPTPDAIAIGLDKLLAEINKIYFSTEAPGFLNPMIIVYWIVLGAMTVLQAVLFAATCLGFVAVPLLTAPVPCAKHCDATVCEAAGFVALTLVVTAAVAGPPPPVVAVLSRTVPF